MKRFFRLRLLVPTILLALIGFVAWRVQVARRQERLDTQLLHAVTVGQEQTVARLLKEGAEPDTCFDTQTHQPLLAAPVLQTWLARLRHLPTTDPAHRTPVLSLAIAYGRKAIASQLLEQGANANAPDGLGSTPLLYAADHNARDILIDLLDHHADVNHKNREGNTALHVAVMQKNLVDCQLLIDRGADVNAANREGQSPLAIVAGMAAEVHGQWLGAYVQALSEPPLKPRSQSGLNSNAPLPLPQSAPPPAITRHYQHQLDLLRPFLDMLQKHGATPSADTQRLLTDSFLLDPHEAEEGLVAHKTR